MAQFLPAPTGARIGSVDVYPNLLVTTLAVAAVSLLPTRAGRAIESAPQVSRAVQCELSVRPLTLGVNPQPGVQRWGEPAPSSKYPVQVDRFANLSIATLSQPVAAPFLPLDTSQHQPRTQVLADAPLRPLTLGINPQPAPLRLEGSAPGPKLQVQTQAYPNTLVLGKPQVLQSFTSAPSLTYAVQADVYPRLLTLASAPPLTGAATLSLVLDLTGAPLTPTSSALLAVSLDLSGLVDSGVQKAGPVDSPRSAQGWRRKRKQLKLPPVQSVIERAPSTAVIAQAQTFQSLADLTGKPLERLRADVDHDIELLMREAAERDDEEALLLILTALD